MTDDVTRGLRLLADEVAAASIDTEAVIASANALSRNRAILTTALVTLAVLCALVVTLGAVKAPPPIADKPKATHAPVIGTESQKPATPQEQARRRKALQGQVTRAFDRILPDGWARSTFDFACDQMHCWAEGEIKDGAGPVTMGFYLSNDYSITSCFRPHCARKLLKDGTLVAFSKFDDVDSPMPGRVPVTRLDVGSVRPDGTSLDLSVSWPLSRTAPVLTDDQWREFATVFTY
jgi:hypothetical protein